MFNLFRVMRDPNPDPAAGGGSPDSAAGAQGGAPAAGAKPDAAAPAAGGAAVAGAAGEFKIPKEFADKGWAKKVKSQDDLFKQLDSLDSVAGKKFAVPDLSKIEDPDVKAYIETLRGGTKKEDYKFGGKTKPEVATKYADSFYNNGIPKSIADRLVSDHEKIQEAEVAAMFSKDGMTVELKKIFGDAHEKKAGEVVNILASLLSPEDKAFVENGLPNNVVAFMYKHLNVVHEKYGAVDTGAGAGGGEGGGGTDVAKVRSDLRAQIRDLTKRAHTADEKKVLQDKLDATYK